MKASELKKNETVKHIVDVFYNRYFPKYHNCDLKECYRSTKWEKYSLSELYKKPSQIKKEIEYDILKSFDDIQNDMNMCRITPWLYSGNNNTFSMWADFETVDGIRIGLRFTKDYLHIVGYDN